jgi:hypothetical protein
MLRDHVAILQLKSRLGMNLPTRLFLNPGSHPLSRESAAFYFELSALSFKLVLPSAQQVLVYRIGGLAPGAHG